MGNNAHFALRSPQLAVAWCSVTGEGMEARICSRGSESNEGGLPFRPQLTLFASVRMAWFYWGRTRAFAVLPTESTSMVHPFSTSVPAMGWPHCKRANRLRGKLSTVRIRWVYG